MPIYYLSAATNIVQLPLAFVRSGNVTLYYGRVNYVGESGYGWSRTSRSSTVAYVLGMDPTDVNPSIGDYRYYGFPLRCLCTHEDKKR